MAFGKYIRREREGRDMTLTELARRVEVSIADLSRIERERENPPPDRLVSALASALGLPTDDLFAARRLPPDMRARRICAGSCDPTHAITTTSERTGHWIRMRRSLARFSGPEASNPTPSLADFITITFGFRFSVHTSTYDGGICLFEGSRQQTDAAHHPG
jgi:transcriptional regulator with XRE-family HTH domain